jgi:hypothetical protein
MPLCDNHLSTASAVGLSVRNLTPAVDVLDALLDIYGIKELSFVDTSIEGGGGGREGIAGRREGSAA